MDNRNVDRRAICCSPAVDGGEGEGGRERGGEGEEREGKGEERGGKGEERGGRGRRGGA